MGHETKRAVPTPLPPPISETKYGVIVIYRGSFLGREYKKIVICKPGLFQWPRYVKRRSDALCVLGLLVESRCGGESVCLL
jgi:hypothetical protein